MLQSKDFAYINVMDRALDASWMRQTVIANNLANVDTPYYKREDVRFQSILEDELTKLRYKNLTQAVRDVGTPENEALAYELYVDSPGFSYRIDHNNVDVDTENVELSSEALRYQTVTTALNNEFSRYDTVTRA